MPLCRSSSPKRRAEVMAATRQPSAVEPAGSNRRWPVLAKPFSPADLAQKVADALGRSS